MITEDQVRTLFIEANPVPDLGVIDLDESAVATDLADFKRRSNDMTDLKTRDTSTESRTRPEGRWLVAAFLVLVLGIGAVIAFQGRDQNPPVADPSLTEVDIAMASIETYNSGDFEAWLDYWAPPEEGVDLASELLIDHIMINANVRIDVTEPCAIVSTEQAGTTVECGVHVIDDFHGAAGVEGTGQMTLVFDEDGLLVDVSDNVYSDENGECCQALEDLHTEFHSWLAIAHPDVFAEIGPPFRSVYWYFPGFQHMDASHMTIALQYIDEFVAQSDNYPIGG